MGNVVPSSSFVWHRRLHEDGRFIIKNKQYTTPTEMQVIMIFISISIRDSSDNSQQGSE